MSAAEELPELQKQILTYKKHLVHKGKTLGNEYRRTLVKNRRQT